MSVLHPFPCVSSIVGPPRYSTSRLSHTLTARVTKTSQDAAAHTLTLGRQRGELGARSGQVSSRRHYPLPEHRRVGWRWFTERRRGVGRRADGRPRRGGITIQARPLVPLRLLGIWGVGRSVPCNSRVRHGCRRQGHVCPRPGHDISRDGESRQRRYHSGRGPGQGVRPLSGPGRHRPPQIRRLWLLRSPLGSPRGAAGQDSPRPAVPIASPQAHGLV